jgi:hypothetical protein
MLILNLNLNRQKSHEDFGDKTQLNTSSGRTDCLGFDTPVCLFMRFSGPSTIKNTLQLG